MTTFIRYLSFLLFMGCYSSTFTMYTPTRYKRAIQQATLKKPQYAKPYTTKQLSQDTSTTIINKPVNVSIQKTPTSLWNRIVNWFKSPTPAVSQKSLGSVEFLT